MQHVWLQQLAELTDASNDTDIGKRRVASHIETVNAKRAIWRQGAQPGVRGAVTAAPVTDQSHLPSGKLLPFNQIADMAKQAPGRCTQAMDNTLTRVPHRRTQAME
jgi:hypothetical protein